MVISSAGVCLCDFRRNGWICINVLTRCGAHRQSVVSEGATHSVPSTKFMFDFRFKSKTLRVPYKVLSHNGAGDCKDDGKMIKLK